MKHLSLLLGITLGFAAPLAAQAEQAAPATDTTASRAKSKAKAKPERVVVTTTAPSRRPPQPDKTRYEITTMTVAGSHLPVVIYHYKGQAFAGGNSFAPRRAYRRNGSALDTTGAANVGQALASIDPAFH